MLAGLEEGVGGTVGVTLGVTAGSDAVVVGATAHVPEPLVAAADDADVAGAGDGDAETGANDCNFM